ncbi:uncharacterized protein N7498_001014 [Penicillium cinerascens]|uniref:Phenylalanine ammonia-lyase n=1 Tax=Penicillium cinerascens TaxID=70096 RepID=A0A9W9TET1_9EURO|nr:uncharacterized protein N7498_001014 [Penicillium cinerascens]KAJ5218915.1 hypothetical protein N7498_001014 [Penicillium cinerascens]
MRFFSGSGTTVPAPLAPHKEDTLRSWNKLNSVIQKGCVDLDGEALDIASVAAVARDGCGAQISNEPWVAQKVLAGVQTLNEYLAKGYSIYGVNTGFGGSADTRTTHTVRLQEALLQLTQAGILTSSDCAPRVGDYNLGSHAMPVAWVRATMLVRCNHLLRGHSGVRLEIIEAMLKLLREGFTPLVPLRGSISASGDLMPLSYLVAVLEGNPDVKVHWDSKPETKVVSTTTALEMTGIKPFVLGPKEGLGLVNGAAASAAVASLAAHEASQLVILAQSLTAMTCEAMMGNAENYHEFPARIRPHPGQIEVAGNIRKGLEGSKLVETSDKKDRFRPGLIQDRYALRGASQWLGPVVEDLGLAVQQLTTELNSTQDNPVIDSDTQEVYSCSNFQAASVSVAMGKVREGLQMVGKLLFSYSSELINPDLSKGLPPNLAADDPSLSFTMKGVDISMASYMSELGFLANSVTSHVQSAEMHNQPINSLALISARYTLQAVELVSMMSAALLYVVCQALDLRLLHETFLNKLDGVVQSTLPELLDSSDKETMIKLQTGISKAIRGSWKGSSREDLSLRIQGLSTAMAPVLLTQAKSLNVEDPIAKIESVQQRICQEAQSLYEETRSRTLSGELNAESSLGSSSKSLYRFVRRDLNVPFHCGLLEHPTIDSKIAGVPQRPRKTIGSWISIIYEAIRDGRIRSPLS